MDNIVITDQWIELAKYKDLNISSSNIHSIFYETKSRTLQVIFKNKFGVKTSRYIYYNVPLQVFNELMKKGPKQKPWEHNTQKSKGSWFYHNIRLNYRYLKIGLKSEI